jgi:hypothetical protein
VPELFAFTAATLAVPLALFLDRAIDRWLLHAEARRARHG